MSDIIDADLGFDPLDVGLGFDPFDRAETAAFIKSQQVKRKAFLAKCAKDDKIRKRLENALNEKVQLRGPNAMVESAYWRWSARSPLSSPQ